MSKKKYAGEPNYTRTPEDINSHWKAGWSAKLDLFADAKIEAEAKHDWLENCNLATSEIKAKYGVDTRYLWFRFGPRPFPSPHPRKWEPDAKLKSDIEADWFGNPDMSNEDIAAKYGISTGKLHYHFGKRGLPIGRPKGKAKVPIAKRRPKQKYYAWKPEDIYDPMSSEQNSDRRIGINPGKRDG